MKKRIATILITSLIICNTFIARAEIIFNDDTIRGVKWNEYTLKQDVYEYYASMSELLEKMFDINTLTPLIEKNPTAKYIRDKNMKERERKDQGGGQ